MDNLFRNRRSLPGTPFDVVTKDEDDQWTPGKRTGGTQGAATTYVVDTAKDDPTANTVGGTSPSHQQQDELVRAWGSLTYDPEKRRKEYLDRMSNIFRNTAALEALAIMTGNPTRAAGYNKMMMGMLDQEIKFDSEDRLYELSKALYYDNNGKFDPPKTKLEAFHALVKMGASVNEATSITGHVPESVAKDLVEWFRINPQTGLKESVSVPGKKGRPAGTGWSKSREFVEGQWDDDNPDISLPTTTENERATRLEQILLAELRTKRPGTAEYNSIMTQLRSVKGSDPQKRFSEIYLTDNTFADWKKIMVPDGVDEKGNPKERPAASIEEAMGWWANPSNITRDSYNFTKGWTPQQEGVVTTAGVAQAPAKNAAEFEAQVRAQHPGAKEEDIEETVRKWMMDNMDIKV